MSGREYSLQRLGLWVTRQWCGVRVTQERLALEPSSSRYISLTLQSFGILATFPLTSHPVHLVPVQCVTGILETKPIETNILLEQMLLKVHYYYSVHHSSD